MHESSPLLQHEDQSQNEKEKSLNLCIPPAVVEVRHPLAVNFFGGLLYGFAIGMLPLLMQYDKYISDCSRYETPDLCESMTFARCSWNASACHFPDFVNCSEFSSSKENCTSSILTDGGCFWRFHKAECDHFAGMSAASQGLLCGMQIVGAIISAAASGWFADRFGRRTVIRLVSGLGGFLATATLAVGWQMFANYPALLVSEFLIGFASGTLGVVCPLYVGEALRNHRHRHIVGAVFQVCCVSGVFLGALLGIIINPESSSSSSSGSNSNTTADADAPAATAVWANIQTRFQIPVAIQLLLSIAVMAVSCVVPESSVWENEIRGVVGTTTNDDDHDDESSYSSSSSSDVDGDEKSKKSCCASSCSSCCCLSSSTSPRNRRRRRICLALLVGFALACAMSLSGIQAVIVFAPSFGSKVGLTPFQANFAVGCFNLAAVLSSFFFTKRYEPKKLFVTCSFLVSLACALVAIALWPGVLEHGSKAQRGLSATGLLLVVLMYQAGTGPSFYPLAVECGFPRNLRAVGASFVLWCAFACALLTNFCFPQVRELIAGGPSGDDDKGLAGTFFIFSGVGLLSSLFLWWKFF